MHLRAVRRWATVLAVVAVLGAAADARADVWVAGTGGKAHEVAHRLDIVEADGMARVTMRRTVRNEGERTADLVLAFRVTPGAVANHLAVPGKVVDGLAMPGAGRASLRWAGPDLLVAALPDVAPGAERTFEVQWWAPLAARHRSFDLKLPGPDRVEGMAPRRTVVAEEREPPWDQGRDRIVSLARPSPRHARARHAYLPLGDGGVLLAELDAPRFLSPRVNPAQTVLVIDVPPAERDRGLLLAGAYVGRFAGGAYQVLLPGDPVETLTETFVDATGMLGALEARFAQVVADQGGPATATRTSVDAMLKAAMGRFGELTRPVRLVLVSDRTALEAESVAAATAELARLPQGSAVHVVAIGTGMDGLPGRRDDGHPLAGLVARHNGIVARFDPDVEDLDAASRVMGHLVRPMWLDAVDLVIGPEGTAPDPDGPGTRAAPRGRVHRVTDRLGERRAVSTVIRIDEPPDEVVWQGRLWAGWWSKRSEPAVAMDQSVALRAIAAPWFADLPVSDQDRLARLTGAVTARWSWEATTRGAQHVRR
jgi:hypothetical protein